MRLLLWIFAFVFSLVSPPASIALQVRDFDPARHERFVEGSVLKGSEPGWLLAQTDASGIGWSEDGFCVSLITPRHFITAFHCAPRVGSRVSFKSRDDKLWSATVLKVQELNGGSPGGQSDICLGTLAEEPGPGDAVRPLAVLQLASPEMYAGLEVILVGRNHRTGIGTVRRIVGIGHGGQTRPPSAFFLAIPASDAPGSAVAEPGDSGGPALIRVGGRLALVGPMLRVSQGAATFVGTLSPFSKALRREIGSQRIAFETEAP